MIIQSTIFNEADVHITFEKIKKQSLAQIKVKAGWGAYQKDDKNRSTAAQNTNVIIPHTIVIVLIACIADEPARFLSVNHPHYRELNLMNQCCT